MPPVVPNLPALPDNSDRYRVFADSLHRVVIVQPMGDESPVGCVPQRVGLVSTFTWTAALSVASRVARIMGYIVEFHGMNAEQGR